MHGYPRSICFYETQCSDSFTFLKNFEMVVMQMFWYMQIANKQNFSNKAVFLIFMHSSEVAKIKGQNVYTDTHTTLKVALTSFDYV